MASPLVSRVKFLFSSTTIRKTKKIFPDFAPVSKIKPTFETLFGENKTKKDFSVS